MNETHQALLDFAHAIKDSQVIWGLTADAAEEDWVVVESLEFENTEVLLVWSSEAAAQATCTDEWADYKPTAIPVAEYFDFWLEALGKDGVRIGIDWQDDAENNVEAEMVELARVLAESGVYQDQ
ncbi:DUF2750 domain-containing protein [Catenovulum sediminis]|uniref:DUF2750 domain-containing protein n=1 Tax=Catenovulum sediminis TaxID=1740262 RepID=A0ABV1RFY1_9ALTE|nr:DUF2750 domain-containing protein [Catenovulum sediminis]